MRLGLALVGIVVAALLTAAMLLNAGWTRPPVIATQGGYRGTGLVQVTTPAARDLVQFANALPEVIEKASPDGEKATAAYQNVQVLTDLSADQFNRVMLAITNWVAPEQGCTYCHNPENLADDGIYTKIVARRMLQMTRAINQEWKPHVAATGVTCYTCHRGKPVPANIWFTDPGGPHAGGFASTNNGMGHPTKANGLTTMPIDPLTGQIGGTEKIRVASTQPFPMGLGASIQATEKTYALMLNMSDGLGVNCGFCHTSRAFFSWDESSPKRLTAWHGIQMARSLNATYLDPLKPNYPPHRLGPTGDAAKVNCATCHQGVSKPLNGAPMAGDYPELGGVAAP